MSDIQIVDKILYYEFFNFLEIYIHTVLYVRDVYPRESFCGYEIYNTKFKFMIDDTVCLYVSDFLKCIENFVFLKFLKKVYICIIDDSDNSIIEIFNLDVNFASIICDFEHEELRLYFKSLLSNFWFKYINKQSPCKDKNSKFHLCIETKETKVISNFKLYKEILNNMEDNYIKNIFTNDFLTVYKNCEICVQDSEFNLEITIYRNFK
jgi:hypothetical protein